MKKNLTIVCIVLVGVFSYFVITQNNTTPSQSGEQEALFEKIDSASFEEKYKTDDYIVIDVRTPEEYAQGRVVTDSVLINFYDNNFKEQLNKLDKDQPYLIHCKSGGRSGQTLPLMQELGFTHVYELEGGTNAWIRSGRELVKEITPEVRDVTPILNQPTICPMDAKICPDGTSVSREGPGCTFAPCL